MEHYDSLRMLREICRKNENGCAFIKFRGYNYLRSWICTITCPWGLK